MAGTPGHVERCQVCVQEVARYGDGEGGEGKREGRDARVKLLGLVLATPDYAGYSLVVTEHSLGSGTRVRHYADSPPGG